MPGLDHHLRQLQNKPYKTRLKILWMCVGIAAILILSIWIITLHYRQAPRADGTSRFQPMIDGFNQLKKIKFK